MLLDYFIILSCKVFDMPLKQVFITSKYISVKVKYTYMPKLLLGIVVVSIIWGCGSLRWHSVEQIPAEAVAYMRDGVFVSGKYIRSAKITKIDNIVANETVDSLHQISIGTHEVIIHCAEAEGAFNSNELKGKTKNLVFKAEIQRTYLVRCEPFTHWWIEDLESKAVVAGEKYMK